MSASDEKDVVTGLPPAELEAVKTSLAELSHSPDLEDAIVSMAREAPGASQRPPALRIWPWLVPAAAALIAAAVLVFQGRSDEEPAEPADPNIAAGKQLRAQTRTPASPLVVAAARAQNRPIEIEDAHELRFGYRCEWAKGGLFEMWTDEHIEPIPKSLQRYVVDRKAGIPTSAKALTYYSWPQDPGVMLMGPEMLVPVNAMINGAGAKMVVHTKEGKWSAVPGSRHMELTLGAPGPNAPETRVRVVISTAYTGTLMVDEPLARALGLQHFELPGGFVAKLGGQESPVKGQRALARVRIPELEYDRVVEVQVRAPHHPRSAQPIIKHPNAKRPAGWIQVTGTAPSAVMFCDQLHFSDKDELVVHSDDGRESMAFGLSEKPLPLQVRVEAPGAHQLGMTFKAEAKRQPATLFMGAYDFGGSAPKAYSFHVEWVTLAGTDEPGARVTVAKVWRGTAAVPSNEAVVVTRVGTDGKIRFPRIRGEAGSRLRMFVERRGSSSFHDVNLDQQPSDMARIGFTALSNGTVRFASSTYRVMEDPVGATRSMAAEIEWWMKGAAERGTAVTTADWIVEVHSEPDAPWQAVQCILMAAAEANVRKIRHFAVRDADEAAPAVPSFVDNDLPADMGMSDGDLPKPTIVVIPTGTPDKGYRVRVQVKLPTKREKTSARVTVGDPIPLTGDWKRRLRARLTESAGPVATGAVAEIRITPNTMELPHGIVQTFIEMLNGIDVRQVIFSGPMPRRITPK